MKKTEITSKWNDMTNYRNSEICKKNLVENENDNRYCKLKWMKFDNDIRRGYNEKVKEVLSDIINIELLIRIGVSGALSVEQLLYYVNLEGYDINLEDICIRLNKLGALELIEFYYNIKNIKNIVALKYNGWKIIKQIDAPIINIFDKYNDKNSLYEYVERYFSNNNLVINILLRENDLLEVFFDYKFNNNIINMIVKDKKGTYVIENMPKHFEKKDINKILNKWKCLESYMKIKITPIIMCKTENEAKYFIKQAKLLCNQWEIFYLLKVGYVSKIEIPIYGVINVNKSEKTVNLKICK